MPQTKVINIDFYQVARESRDVLPTIFNALSSLPEDGPVRNLSLGDDPIRLRVLGIWDSHWHGDFTRIRLNDPAFKANLSGRVAPVELDEDEGLGENSAFLYYHRENVLVVQRNRTGVSAGKMAAYFTVMSQTQPAIELLPFLDPTALERLAHMGRIKTFQVKLAQCQQIPAEAQSGSSVGRGIELARLFEAPSMELTLSMSRQEGTLRIGHVVESVRDLLRLRADHRTEVVKLHVTGENGTGDQEPLDLLEQRIVGRGEVRRIPLVDQFYRNRIEALQAAWMANRGRLVTAPI